ncbi:uncharacterized protein TRUGW13939_02217 [Talaromyces rugulosus]|uniref:Uncharacterized protein n=1 Tax=Talaromyces rugulosus TaxID=121627 RepID=A0A7H8QNT7_TALRU|nr:uncharacterized protein TRUGW13939_02217 [Talaromyces rugulosus]QKX55125.1 hypothetical protein TRUGW13939_02217 [Talaromyces rugulosus]
MDSDNGRSQKHTRSNGGRPSHGEFVPEQAAQPQYPPYSALYNTRDLFSAIPDDSLSGYEQTMWPAPDLDLMGFGQHFFVDTVPEILPYNYSSNLSYEPPSYDGSYAPGGYTNARTITTGLQPQPSSGQILDLDSQFSFVPDYHSIGLDQTDYWPKDLGYSGNQILSDPLLDRESSSSIWTIDGSNQDLEGFGGQFENNFTTQLNNSPYSQVQY